MALIDKASLLMVPSTYEAGTLYNVLPSGNRAPDSTDQNSGYDQTRADFTFDRGSNAAATRIGSDGLIKKYRENLLLQSNQFDTTWNAVNASVTSGQSGYDGTNNAWLLSKSAAHGNININLLSSNSNINTFSLYAKANASQWMRMTIGSPRVNVFFNVANGTLGEVSSSAIDTNIEDVGNGWYRFSFSTTYAAWVEILPAETMNDTGGTTGSIYIQSAQVETGMVSTDYLDSGATTAKAGVLIDLPRINYDANGENGALLLEPSRANLVQYSEYFGGWNAFNSTITNNSITSPEGVKNAAKLTEDSSSAYHDADISFTFSAVSNVFSVFVKAAGRDKIFLQQFDGSTFHSSDVFDLTNGTYAGGAEGDIEDFGNGWFRCHYIKTTAAGSGKLYINLHNGTSGNYAGDGTSGVYLYGAQLEASASYPSSYIPNHGESGGVTRAADSCSVTGVSDVIGQTEGTMFVDVDAETIGKMGSNGTQRVIMVSDGTNTNRTIINFFQNSSGVTQVEANLIKGTSQASFANTISENKKYKLAFAYKANDFTFYVNGVQIGTDTSGSTYSSGTLTRLDLGQDRTATLQQANPIKQAVLFKERLSNAELATLTTL